MNKLYKKLKNGLLVGVATFAILGFSLSESKGALVNAGKADINYVSLGDSMTTGFGYDDYYVDDADGDFYKKENGHKNTRGFLTAAEESYPALIAKELNKFYDVKWTQLSGNAMRVDDIYYALHGYDNPGDDFYDFVFNTQGNEKWFNVWGQRARALDYTTNTDNTEAVHETYYNAVKDADYITLQAGFNNFGCFLTGRLGTLIETNNGMVSSLLPTWAGKDSLQDFCDRNGIDLDIAAIYEGVYDLIYHITGFDVRAFKDIELMPGTTVHVEDIVDTLIHAFVSYCYYYNALTNYIYEINPDVKLFVLGLYNTEETLTVSLGGNNYEIGQIYSYLLDAANLYTAAFAHSSYKYYYVDLKSVDPNLHFDKLAIDDLDEDETNRLYEGVVSLLSDYFGLTKLGEETIDASLVKEYVEGDYAYDNFKAVFFRSVVANIQAGAAVDVVSFDDLLAAAGLISSASSLEDILLILSDGRLSAFLNLYVRILMSNGIWMHPSAEGHIQIAQAVTAAAKAELDGKYPNARLMTICKILDENNPELLKEYYPLIKLFVAKDYDKIIDEYIEPAITEAEQKAANKVAELLSEIKDEIRFITGEAADAIDNVLDDLEEFLKLEIDPQIIQAKNLYRATVKRARRAIEIAQSKSEEIYNKVVAECRKEIEFQRKVLNGVLNERRAATEYYENAEDIIETHRYYLGKVHEAYRNSIKHLNSLITDYVAAADEAGLPASEFVTSINQEMEQRSEMFGYIGEVLLKLWPFHPYGVTSYEWNEDYTSCVATKKCQICDFEWSEEALFVIPEVIQEETPYQEGIVRYTAVFFWMPTMDITENAKDVTYGRYTNVSYHWSFDSEFGWECTATGIDSITGEEYEDFCWYDYDVAKDPTCESNGTSLYIAHFYLLGSSVLPVNDIPALGHDVSEQWSHDGDSHWHTCAHDPLERLDESAHTYDMDTVSYTWDDDHTSCTASVFCEVCGYVHTESASSITPTVIHDPTCLEVGTTRYVAEFDTLPSNTVEVDDIEALGHDDLGEWKHDDNYHWTECGNNPNEKLVNGVATENGEAHDKDIVDLDWSYEDGAWKCKATLKCSVCGYVHCVEESVKVEFEAQVIDPTCHSRGYNKYTAVFPTLGSFDMYLDEIPELPHHIETEWSYGEMSHWHSCTDDECYTDFDWDFHTFGDASYNWYQDEGGNWCCSAVKACTVCGYEYVEDAYIESDVYAEATTDSKGSTIYIAYFMDFDPVYKVVEDKPAIRVSDAWSTDANYHWHAGIDNPNDKFNNEKHTFLDPVVSWSLDDEGNWVCTVSKVCSVCGYKVETTVGSTSNVIKISTCDTKGTTRYTAEFADYGTYYLDVDDIPALGHDILSDYSFDEDCHWKGCSHNASERFFVEDHVYGTATYNWIKDGENWICVAKAKCVKCGFEHTETAVVTKSVKTQPTLTSKGVSKLTATFATLGSTTKDVDDIPALSYVLDNGFYKVNLDQIKTGVNLSGMFGDAAAKGEGAALKIGDATIEFSPKAVAEIAKKNNATFSFEFVDTDVDNYDLMGTPKALVKVALTSNGNKILFNEGYCTITIKHDGEPGFGQRAKVYFINEDYDELVDMSAVLSDGEISFTTDHFSDFVAIDEFSYSNNEVVARMILDGVGVIAIAGAIALVVVLLKKKKASK